MAQYINKDALVAKINTLLDDEFRYNSYDEATGFQNALTLIKKFIDTLEVKDVDLEKEAEKYADHITAELYRRSDKHYDKEKKCMASVLYNVNWSEIGKEMEKCFIEGAKWKTKEE